MKKYAFYYIRGEKVIEKKGKKFTHRPPAVTVCIAESDIEGWYLRGIAICSAKDTPEKNIIPFTGMGNSVYQELADINCAPDNVHGGRDWAMRRVKRAERMLKTKLKREPNYCSTLNSDPINSHSKNVSKAFETHGINLLTLPTFYKTVAIQGNNLTDQEKELLK